MTAPAERTSPVRLRAARVLAAVLCLVAAVPYFGVIDLVTLVGWVNPEYLWPVPLDVSWGALFTFFLAGGYAWVALAPHRSAPGLAALVVGGLSLVAGAAGGTDFRPLPVAIAVLVSAVALALLTGLRSDPPAWRISWPYLALALLGAALWVPYVLSALEQSRLGIGREITNGVDHWPVQAAAGLAILAGSAGLAVWRPGRSMLRVATGLSAGLIGVAALAYPEREGATEGVLWAIVAVLWALALMVVPVAPTSRKAANPSPPVDDSQREPDRTLQV
ncbi:hypothetical protein [Naasia sp. SYSU D00948]|uniref:hypothetical protein n=1 Tax=Naasia sp. SYSU D00948 TaxID=2817379 RepID=UPI001B3180A7|nr:hypothetical protein [Naasia sp. SYSU D00948]